MVRERKVVMGQRGMIHVYCGDGKGKTSAALGIDDPGSRAGKKILFVRFFENDDSEKIAVLEQISSICQLRMQKCPILLDDDKGSEKRRAEKSIHKGLESIEEQAGEFDVLIRMNSPPHSRYGLRFQMSGYFRFLERKSGRKSFDRTGSRRACP